MSQDVQVSVSISCLSYGVNGMASTGPRWEQIVQAELKRLKKKEDAIAQDPKGADWKVRIAKRLRKETTAKKPGSPNA